MYIEKECSHPKEKHGIPHPAPGAMTVVYPPPHWPPGGGCTYNFLLHQEHGLKATKDHYVVNCYIKDTHNQDIRTFIIKSHESPIINNL